MEGNNMVEKTQATEEQKQGTVAPAQNNSQQPGQAGATKPDQKEGYVPLPALQEERERVRELKEQLANLTSVVQEMQNRGANNSMYPPQQYPQQQMMPRQNQNFYPAQSFQNPISMQQQAEQMWEDDPVKATAWMVEAGIQNYDSVQRIVDHQKAQVMAKYKDYANYATDIDNYVRALPPSQRAQQGIIDMAYFLVKGQKVDNLTQQAQKDLLDKMRRGESVEGVRGTYTAPVNTENQTLTPEEQNAAMAMGLKPEEYMQYRGVKSRR